MRRYAKPQSRRQEGIIRERFAPLAPDASVRAISSSWDYSQVDGMRPPEEVTLDILTVLDIEGIPLKSPVARRT